MKNNKTKIPKKLQDLLTNAATASPDKLVKLVKNPIIRKSAVREVEKLILNHLLSTRTDPSVFPGIAEDRAAIGLAIAGSIERGLQNGSFSDEYLSGILNNLVKTLFFEKGDESAVDRFEEEFGLRAPSFLLISPGKACNLRCKGCYADSDNERNALEWHIVDRMIQEAKALWGVRFIVISGGEPFAYRSEGKGIIDLCEKHSDCFFMTYTNSTLITEKVSHRLAKAGNMLLCISVEGWQERTDERRGKGVYNRVLAVMDQLREDGVPFGLSLTGTRYNVEEILSDAFIDFFMEKGALFSWLFQYMPIGRAFTLDLMVTPQQRAWMWKRSWEIMREKKFFLADFWNHGTACDGCLSAGGHGNGGYFYIDWNGAITPCVFMPYSPVNIRDIYAQGGDLNTVWQDPFFTSLRNWQLDYKAENRNGLAPCPSRDHHDELEVLLRRYEPDPIDINASETLIDPEYTHGLAAYNRAFEALTDDIWQSHYIHRHVTKDELLSPLPDIPTPENIGINVDNVLVEQ